MTICSLCQGAKHVLQNGCWQPCPCLSGKRSIEAYRKAGIPLRFDTESWRSCLREFDIDEPKTLLSAAKKLRAKEQPSSWIILTGRPFDARAMLGALILKAACDGGLSAAQADLPTLIDIEFNREEASNPLGPRIYGVGALVILCGEEPRHSYNKRVIERAVRYRWDRNLFTLIVSERDPGNLADRYESNLLRAMIRDRIEWIKVRPRR